MIGIVGIVGDVVVVVVVVVVVGGDVVVVVLVRRLLIISTSLLIIAVVIVVVAACPPLTFESDRCSLSSARLTSNTFTTIITMMMIPPAGRCSGYY